MRQIELASTKSFNGAIEENAAVRVYDTSGPWGDPHLAGDVEEGLPSLRRSGFLSAVTSPNIRDDMSDPEDNGYLSAGHARAISARRGGLSPFETPKNAKRQPLRASGGHPSRSVLRGTA